MNSKKFLLNHIDPEDIGQVVHKVSQSFNLRFEIYELKGIKTFEQLCNVIYDKLKDRQAAEVCTAQHAFYKLRNAITGTTGTDRNEITIKTCLKDLLPQDQALSIVASVESELGLRRKKDKQKAIANFISLVKASVSGKSTSSVLVKTLGQLAEKMSRQHHQQCKQTPASFTRDQIAQKLFELFPHQTVNQRDAFTEPTFG